MIYIKFIIYIILKCCYFPSLSVFLFSSKCYNLSYTAQFQHGKVKLIPKFNNRKIKFYVIF